MVSLNGKLFMLGGWNNFEGGRAERGDGVGNFVSETCSEVWSSIDGREWTLECEAPWEGRHCFGAVVHDAHMWVVGGDNARGPYQTDIWKSPDGVNWSLVTAVAPWPERALHLVAVFDNSLWVMGGQQNSPAQAAFLAGEAGKYETGGAETHLKDVWRSNDGSEWTLVTDDAPWAPRGMITGSNGGVAVHNNRMWILGGGYVGPQGVTLSSLKYDLKAQPRMKERLYYNDVWSSGDGATWVRHLEHAPWCPRSYHDVAVFASRLWVIGGQYGVAQSEQEVGTEGNLADTWYSMDGMHWESVQTPWTYRHACAVRVRQVASRRLLIVISSTLSISF